MVARRAARVEDAGKSRVRVAKFQQRQRAFHNGPPDLLLHFVSREVVTVDVPADAGSGEERHVVAAGEQPDVVDLRDARQETLNGPSDEVLVVSAAERVVNRAVDLIGVEIAGGAAGGLEALAAAALVDLLHDRTDFNGCE